MGLSTVQAATIAFDGITGGATLAYNTVNNHYVGSPLNFANGVTTIDSLAIRWVAAFAANYTGGIRFNIQFWENFNSAGNPVFSGSLGQQSFTIGATSFGAFTTNSSTFTLNPVTFADGVNNGIVINIQGDSGSGFVDTNGLTTMLSFNGTAPTVGSVPLPNPLGIYNSNNNSFNFTSVDYKSSSGSQLVLAVVASGPDPVPEPGSITLMATGALTLLLSRLRKR